MNWNTNWARPDQCWTSLMGSNPCSRFNIWWKDWNQKRGGCYSCRLMLMASQSHMGVMFRCLDTFVHMLLHLSPVFFCPDSHLLSPNPLLHFVSGLCLPLSPPSLFSIFISSLPFFLFLIFFLLFPLRLWLNLPPLFFRFLLCATSLFPPSLLLSFGLSISVKGGPLHNCIEAIEVLGAQRLYSNLCAIFQERGSVQNRTYHLLCVSDCVYMCVCLVWPLSPEYRSHWKSTVNRNTTGSKLLNQSW